MSYCNHAGLRGYSPSRRHTHPGPGALTCTARVRICVFCGADFCVFCADR